MIVAPSFGDIFAANSAQIGLLTVSLPEEQLDGLKAASEATVDLETQTIATEGGSTVSFDFDPFRRHKLLNGLDDIGLTLEHEDEIAAYESAGRRASTRPRCRSAALADREGDGDRRLDELRPGLDRRRSVRSGLRERLRHRRTARLADVGDPPQVQPRGSRDRLRLALGIRDRGAKRDAIERGHVSPDEIETGPWFAPASTAASIVPPILERLRMVAETELVAV